MVEIIRKMRVTFAYPWYSDKALDRTNKCP